MSGRITTEPPRVIHNAFAEPAQAGDASRHPCLFVAMVLVVLFVAALSCVASGVR